MKFSIIYEAQMVDTSRAHLFDSESGLRVAM